MEENELSFGLSDVTCYREFVRAWLYRYLLNLISALYLESLTKRWRGEQETGRTIPPSRVLRQL